MPLMTLFIDSKQLIDSGGGYPRMANNFVLNEDQGPVCIQCNTVYTIERV
jgi:hypothetical protein